MMRVVQANANSFCFYGVSGKFYRNRELWPDTVLLSSLFIFSQLSKQPKIVTKRFSQLAKSNPVDKILNEARLILTPRLFCTFLRSLNFFRDEACHDNKHLRQGSFCHLGRC